MNNEINIFIIDDDSVFLRISSMIIRRTLSNARVSMYQNGEEALEAIQTETPDFILLDINMPIMTGWEFLEEFKKFSTIPKIPIYILSSSIDPEDQRKAQSEELIWGFIEKPLSSSKILEIKYIE